MSQLSQSRRSFLKMAGLAGGGLILGIPLAGCSSAKAPAFQTEPQALAPNAFLQITSDNRIFFYLPNSEMGQGVYSGLTTLVAEELEVPPEAIEVRHADVHRAYRNPDFGMQGTGGSTSLKGNYQRLRQAGANAREVLRAAAAQQLNAPSTELQLKQGQVFWQGNRYPYGQFAALASTLPVPEDTPLKAPKDFTLIGKDRPRLDAIAKTTGTAEFGIDIEIPDLYRAVLVRCPVFGGQAKGFNAEPIKALPGVKTVVSSFNGVAVVAETYWQARKAAAQLEVEWDLPEKLSRWSSDALQEEFKGALDSEKGEKAEKIGKGAAALAKAAKTVSADYWAPYLAHATLEPLNCTVRLQPDHCDVWVGTQMPEGAQGIAALHAGLDKDQVAIHSTFLGGGFGRRGNLDYVAEAVSIAKATGLAIQLVWSREDDTRHDWYRPAAMARFEAGLDEQGQLHSWSVKRVGPNMMPYVMDEAVDAMLYGAVPTRFADWLSKRGFDLFESWVVEPFGVEGLFEDYEAPNKEIRHITRDPGLRVGFWRSVGHSFSGFFKESFMDELAHAANRDPLEMRLAHTQNNPRLRQVIQQAADLAGWGKPLAPGHFQGIAAQKSFDTYVAQVAEVSVVNNQIRVHRVFCAVDCGLVVNPDIVKAQMESGIIFGLTAALHGEITLQDGAVVQSNFHDYPMLRMNESPSIEVRVVASQEEPSGVGEPGVPPIAPAVANALFAATGQRLRSLPLKLG